MGQEGDDRLSLPVPPPPNPAARRAAIDAAMRKFDGLDPAPTPRKRFSLAGWASTHRAAAGGLVTAALIAVISIPAIQVAIRDHPPVTATEDSLSRQPQASAPDVTAEAAAPPPQAAASEPTPAPSAAPIAPVLKEAGRADLATQRDNKAVISTVNPAPVVAAPMMAAPPPAPPPPPPPPPAPQPQAQPEAADSVGNIVVTGSRVRAPQSQGFAQRSEAKPSPAEIMAPYGDFLGKVQEAIAGNDRRALLGLVGLPLIVRFPGGSRTYRTRQDVERDYDRIFTPEVRSSILNSGSWELQSRDGGKLRGTGRIWFGCGLRTCSSGETVRVREITP